MYADARIAAMRSRLTLIEALYINHRFNQKFKGTEKANLEEKAIEPIGSWPRSSGRHKKDLMDGKPEAEILTGLARERVRCPLLNTQIFAISTRIAPDLPILRNPYGHCRGGHTCGLSGSKKVKPTPLSTWTPSTLDSRSFQPH